MAIEIAKSDDDDVQRALTQAYAEKKLRGRKLVAVRRLIDQRRRRGKHLHGLSYRRRDGSKRPLTTDSMIRVYRQEADRQRLLIKKAEVTQNRLLFVVEAIRALREDKDFARLLQIEKLELMPTFLEQQLAARPAQ
jgi:ParB family chromosome partitioning protein